LGFPIANLPVGTFAERAFYILSVVDMSVSEAEVHYYTVTICFPGIFFLLIVLYLYFKGWFKRQL
jgi:hypothetical protein